MPTKVIMPQMGESIFEGTITKWLKKVGDKIKRDEPLFEISTDKVDSEIPAPAEGILTEILVPEGKTVQINTIVAIIDGSAGQAVQAAAAATVTQPQEREETVSHAPEELAAAQVVQPAPPKIPVIELAREVPPKPPIVAAPAPTPPRPVAALLPVQTQDIRTSPLVRRLAREHNIDLSQVTGTGLGGRITKEDVLNKIERREKVEAPGDVEASLEPAITTVLPASQPPAETSEPPVALQEASRFIGESATVPMSPMRKAIAERMVLSKQTSAHVSTVFEVDMTGIVRLREKHKVEFEKREGIKLTYTPFFVKALTDTIREFPIFNASVAGDSIVYKKSINVGIAVALENGLIVPVVKDAHLKSFTGLALAINNLAERARTKKLRPDDVQNGTISITNPGIYGSLFGTPIINQPQVAILGVGGIEKRPVVIDDAIAIRSMVYLSLTFDHRVIDGAVADQFMAQLKSNLQGWSQWIE